MSVTLKSNRIDHSGGLGIGGAPNTSAFGTQVLDINGSINASNCYGDGSNLSGIVKGHQYYAQDNFNGSATNAKPATLKTVTNVPAGNYHVFFHMTWYDNMAPNGDEDWGYMYISASNGTTRTTESWNREENMNGQGTGQGGLQGYSGVADVTLTSTGSIYLRWYAQDTDSGGVGGHTTIQIAKRA
jgi:hypothetical protein